MTEAMKITLSTQPADARWGEKATYSINNDGITLHLNGADDLGLIQRAARKIDGLGIKHVQLSGEGWDADRCWAFWQGYKGPKGTRKVEWPDLDDAQRQELDNRLMIIDWVRDTINAPAEELGPSQLAQRAVDLISNVAGDRVTYRITKGEDLREQGYMGLHTVGRGSERSPVLLALDYNPTGDKEAPVYACLVGKGITFDSGGYSIKLLCPKQKTNLKTCWKKQQPNRRTARPFSVLYWNPPSGCLVRRRRARLWLKIVRLIYSTGKKKTAPASFLFSPR